jgi:prepilin-type N-terminal cleavage/methylation domain-containing protein
MGLIHQRKHDLRHARSGGAVHHPHPVEGSPTPGFMATRGFTLIEVMVTVAIVAILAAVALPSYRDHVLRGLLIDAATGLSTFRAEMERHFQDNRTYESVGSITSPCEVAAAQRTVGNFVISCVAGPAAAAYTLQAVGTGPVAGFAFTVNQRDERATSAAPDGWGTCMTKWVLKRGQPC